MKGYLKILMLVQAFGSAAFGQGTILWDESVNGQLSENAASPTQLGSLQAGTNTIIGATEIEPLGGNNFLVHGDFFTFTVPGGASLNGGYLTVDKPNVSVWIGDAGFSTQLGYTANSSPGNLFPQWQIGDLQPGSYGMYLENHDAGPTLSVANYRLDFVSQSVPEPGLTALGVLGICCLLLPRQKRPCG
jgi:hypothetical protein